MNNNYITIYKTEEELKKVVLNKLWESYTLENFILENVKKKKAMDDFYYGIDLEPFSDVCESYFLG